MNGRKQMRGRDRNGPRQQDRSIKWSVSPDEILSPPEDYDDFLEKIKKSVERDNKTAPHQLRNIHGALLKVRTVQELKRLRYKLAYTGGRIRDTRELCDLLEQAIQRANADEHIVRIREFLEAVIAYQKYFGK